MFRQRYCDVTVSMLTRNVQRVQMVSSNTAAVRTMYVRAPAAKAPAMTTRFFEPLRREAAAAAPASAAAPSAALAALASAAASSRLSCSTAATSSIALGMMRGFRQPLAGNRAITATRTQATDANKGEKAGEEAKAEEGEKGEGEGEQKTEKAPKLSPVEAFKKDFVTFPDIYNSANGFNFILFTIFCLCSTGSQVEADWWLEHWGIDKAFRPWAWVSHSLFCNNFLSMAFAMIMLHSMMHPIMATLGSAGLVTFLGTVSLVSGVVMWAGAYLADYSGEKQFGPWDIVAALFVAQYMHLGFAPWTIMLSFNGWVKYACCLGGVVICYYDWQPLACGAAVGLLLIKTRFKSLGMLVKPKA